MPKCLCCGRDIPKGEQYVVERISKKTGKTRKENYCSKKEYDDLIQLREDKEKVYEKIDLLFGYQVVNNLLKKEVETVFKGYSPSLVYNYLQFNSSYLSIAMEKTFNNEFCKIKYFTAILNNSIKDFKDTEKEENIQDKKVDTIESDVVFNTKFKTKSKRKSLNDIDI